MASLIAGGDWGISFARMAFDKEALLSRERKEESKWLMSETKARA